MISRTQQYRKTEYNAEFVRNHFSGAFHANDEEAVRPKRDMDAEKSAENVNENDAVRHKCDMVVMKLNARTPSQVQRGCGEVSCR